MGRWEFMRKLEELLSDISPSEREEAFQYYNDYFNDAGRKTKEVIEALGSPEEVAEIVRSGLMDDPDKGEFTENGFASQQEAVRQNEIIQSEKVEGSREAGQEKEQGTCRGSQNKQLKIQAALQKKKQKAEKKRMGFRPGRSC
ncbi:MAG: DUF1700 domain-containing protein [Lachnospiraceae bacterium]